MSKIIKILTRKATGQELEEEIAMPDELSKKELEQEFREMADRFNDEEVRRKKEHPEYHMDSKRTFIKIIGDTGEYYCDFEKISIISRHLARGIADTLQCRRCGIKVLRYTLETPQHRKCHPERVCKECNKEFKDLKKHEKTHTLALHKYMAKQHGKLITGVE